MKRPDRVTGLDLGRLRPTLAQLGAAFGTSGRWIGELRARGLMPPDGATLPEAIRAWVAYRASPDGGQADG